MRTIIFHLNSGTSYPEPNLSRFAVDFYLKHGNLLTKSGITLILSFCALWHYRTEEKI